LVAKLFVLKNVFQMLALRMSFYSISKIYLFPIF
jgi:hypothetical protein